MSEARTVNQYAAFARRQDGCWFKIHAFTLKSKEMARRCIAEHINSFPNRLYPCEYKIMRRTVTITTGEWKDE